MSEPISKGGTAHPRLTRQQKAAAVIVSLGTDKASQLYQYMDPEDVEQITLEVAKLGYLDSSATEDVLTEYYQMCMTNKAVTEGGLEYARAGKGVWPADGYQPAGEGDQVAEKPRIRLFEQGG